MSSAAAAATVQGSKRCGTVLQRISIGPMLHLSVALTVPNRASVLFPAQGGSRRIPREEGQGYATSKGWLYMESSAKDVVGIHSSFEAFMLEILERPEILEAIAANKARYAAEREQRSQQSNRSCNLMCNIC